jgi:hypothetical protein
MIKVYLRMFQLRQELPFIHDAINRAFRNDSCLRHLFHCIYLAGLLFLNSPYLGKDNQYLCENTYLTETSPADHTLVGEIIFRYCRYMKEFQASFIIDYSVQCCHHSRHPSWWHNCPFQSVS